MKFTQYLLTTISCCFFTESIAQNPGGVKDYITWQTELGFFNQDEYNTSMFNYHPYRQFDIDGEYHKIGLADFDKISIYSVFSSDDQNTMGVISNSDSHIAITDSKVISSSEAMYKSKLKVPKILFYSEHFGEKAKKQKKEIASFILGDKYNSAINFKGGIAEVLIYNRILNRSEKERIGSYLAIKYGISLPSSDTYFSASGREIFVPIDEYRHHVTCIARDDASGLNQKQSHNVSDESGLEIGLNSIEAMNGDNQSEIKNESFLFWASDHDEALRNNETKEEEINKTWKMIASDESFSGKLLHLRISLPFNKQETIFLVKQEGEKGELLEWVPLKYDFEKQVFECKFKFDEDMSRQTLFTFKRLKKDNDPSVTSILYPNPIAEQDVFFIQHPCNHRGYFTCNIYTSTGELVRSDKFNCISDSNVYSARLQREGVYIVEIEAGEHKTSHKLIVIKK